MRIGWPCHYWNHPCPTSYSLDEQQRPFFGLATHLTKLVIITCYIWGKEQIDEIIILFHIVWSEVQPSICALLILNLWCFLSLKPKTFIKYLNSSVNWRVLLSNRAASSEILMGLLTCLQTAFGGWWWWLFSIQPSRKTPLELAKAFAWDFSKELIDFCCKQKIHLPAVASSSRGHFPELGCFLRRNLNSTRKQNQNPSWCHVEAIRVNVFNIWVECSFYWTIYGDFEGTVSTVLVFKPTCVWRFQLQVVEALRRLWSFVFLTC